MFIQSCRFDKIKKEKKWIHKPIIAKMQRKGILHRDIKPDNILILKKENNTVEYKVADFGFAIMVNAYSQLNVAGTI